MQLVSNEFREAMKTNPYIARLTLDGQDVIECDLGKEIYFRGGANTDEERMVLGAAVSSSVEITIDKELFKYELKGRELFIELGQNLPTGIEWIPMGTYTVESADVDDGVLTIKAQDALYAKFDVDYEPLDGLDFESESGVASTVFLEALCNRRGVAVDISNLEPYSLKNPPDGYTEREIIGFISAMYGGFANMSRLGALRICQYAETDITVTADNYYEDGMEKATYDFAPGWIKCYNGAIDATMFVGLSDAEQGIYMESIWMTTEILFRIWERLQGLCYRPVKTLSFLGDPTLDPGDIIHLEDLKGEIVPVPVMTIAHEFDGGLITNISASGQAKTTSNEGNAKRNAYRSAKRAVEQSKSYTDTENEKLNQLELLKRLTKEWIDDGIYLTDDGRLAINASAIAIGVIASKDGTVKIDLMNNCVEIDTVSGNGHPGKLQLSSNGLKGFGRDTEAEDYVQTLQITPGDNMGDSATMTTFTSVYGDGGVSIAPGKSGAGAFFGTPQSDTRIRGKTVEIGGKPCTWVDNGDNTFTLVGNMENQSQGDMDIKMVRSGQTVTMTTTQRDGSTVVDTIELDENDYPISGTFGGVDCTITMEGI